MYDINNPERLKFPLKDKEGYFYPITSYNQIIMPDGTFWNGESAGGTVSSVNSKTPDSKGDINLTATDVAAMPGEVRENENGVKFSFSDNPIVYSDGEDCSIDLTYGNAVGGTQPAIAFTNRFNRQILTIQKTGSKIYRCTGDLLRKSMIYDEDNPPTASDVGAVFVDRTNATVGPAASINADTLGGLTSDSFALKEDVQRQFDSIADLNWDNIENKPTNFTPAEHRHPIDDLDNVSYEEWTFTFDDGTTATKKVLIVA